LVGLNFNPKPNNALSNSFSLPLSILVNHICNKLVMSARFMITQRLPKKK
jgi:hypothetical protein